MCIDVCFTTSCLHRGNISKTGQTAGDLIGQFLMLNNFWSLIKHRCVMSYLSFRIPAWDTVLDYKNMHNNMPFMNSYKNKNSNNNIDNNNKHKKKLKVIEFWPHLNKSSLFYSVCSRQDIHMLNEAKGMFLKENTKPACELRSWANI